ncbi:hypothetical protein FZC35_01445 [Candidatus Cytomitobacter indipagum]|uniref:Uncharacterized protein n=1 Tax=Candidatus Cytomitobacter indipagum TaxID=2601575 RepID=A0A5C0UDC1_9PROT|nr:NADH-quinone oxidoreductase subunit K [Candidatus Cytomitobacter indipagum]QEK38036.1 hypothetical protein FZC35_01445 [Candidatus Cytomitobacter indipagum]
MILLTFGLYFIRQNNNTSIFGYILIGQAINLFLLYLHKNNLLEQSFILTSIVIGLGMIALLLKK